MLINNAKDRMEISGNGEELQTGSSSCLIYHAAQTFSIMAKKKLFPTSKQFSKPFLCSRYISCIILLVNYRNDLQDDLCTRPQSLRKKNIASNCAKSERQSESLKESSIHSEGQSTQAEANQTERCKRNTEHTGLLI